MYYRGMNLDLCKRWNEIRVRSMALQQESFHSSQSIRERKKEMSRLIWWLDFLSIAMLVATGGWLVSMLSDIISVSGLLPVQTLALVAVVARGFSGPGEKSRNDNVLR